MNDVMSGKAVGTQNELGKALPLINTDDTGLKGLTTDEHGLRGSKKASVRFAVKTDKARATGKCHPQETNITNWFLIVQISIIRVGH
jgi:hypothetical protein